MDEHLGKKLLYAASSVTHIKRFHLEVISALRRDGYAVETLARGADADFDIPFEKRLFSLKNLLLVPRIRKILKIGGYDAVLLNTSLASFFVRLACPRRDRPRTVNIVHGYLFSDKIHSPKAMILRLAEEILRGKTDVIITMNRTDADIARKFRLAREGTLEIPGMGVTLRREITSPEEIRSKFFPEDAYVITFVGELSKRKNQALLIEALKIIKKHIPTSHLCLVGGGCELPTLKALASRLGISQSVSFVGEREDSCDFIRAADLYVSPSLSEGLPFNIIEALGAGKTVLASRIKGHTDIIDDGYDGYLFDLGDAEELSEKVIMIHRLGNALSAERIREKYLKYEKNNVFPKLYSTIKSAINQQL